MNNYFNDQIYNIQHEKISIDLLSATLWYLALVFGLYYFIIRPKKSVLDAFLLGIVIYAVYETTNKALFKKWKWTTVFLDTLWGGILFALTTYAFNSLT
jgi:uncharacterized membrane protein